MITVNQRGALTLPKGVREKAGIPKGGPVRIQVTSEGVLLTPVAAFPIEAYSPERIAEFRLNNAVDYEEYQSIRKEMSAMGLDPDSIPHKPIRKARA